MTRSAIAVSTLACIASATLLAAGRAVADEPLATVGEWIGNVDALLVGTPLAVDTNANGRVDTATLPAPFAVSIGAIPVNATLVKAYLYWGGTQAQPGAPLSSSPDTNVTLILPNLTSIGVVADVSYGSDGGASSYDMWFCRADVTAQIEASGSALIGTYQFDDYTGLIADNASDNASAGLLLVFASPSNPNQHVVLYDGLMTVVSSSESVSLTGLDVDEFGGGTLTYYTMEGDVAGSGGEAVTVNGMPGPGGPITLTDAINPADNPMNQTINTTAPAQVDTIGVDIDRFDISGALNNADTSIDVSYSAGTDKWWLGVNLVSIVSQSVSCNADTNGDGVVDVLDLLNVLGSWGVCPG